MHVAVALSLALAPPSSDPFAGEPGLEPAEDPVAEEVPSSPPAEAAPAGPQIPGVPAGVDLFDEATWTELSLKEKERLRALRAEVLWQAQQSEKRRTEPAPKPSAAELAEVAEMRSAQRSRQEDSNEAWEAKDTSLATATAILGVFGGLPAIGAIGLAVASGESTGDCVESTLSGESTCEDDLEKSRKQAAGSIGLGAVSGLLVTATIVTGIFLGVHRAVGPRRVAFTGDGVRIRF